MLVQHLVSVDGTIVFDIDPDVVGASDGAVRVADGVGVDDVASVARSMTYQHAAFEIRVGGAAAGVRPRLLDRHDETMHRFCDEVRDQAASGRFMASAELGSDPGDLRNLDFPGGRPSVVGQTVDGVAFETAAAARGVGAAIAAWLGPAGLDGRAVAIDGFDRIGAAVAREMVRRGARVVAVSTDHGAVASNAGFDVEALSVARSADGDRFVRALGLEVHASAELHELPVDVVVPCARRGVYSAALAAEVRAPLIVPAVAAPYTVAGLAQLRDRRVIALPDFVTAAGAMLGRNSPRGLSAAEALDRVDRLITERIEAARLAKVDPLDYAATLAETFMTTWIPVEHRPDAPVLDHE